MHAPAPDLARPAHSNAGRPLAPAGGPLALASVDALRGYAILLVMLVHAQQLFYPASEWLARAVSEGARGVQLFYIVSAYTLTRSLLHRLAEASDAHGRRGVYAAYAIRRFFRIAPLFYLVVAVNFLDLGLAPRDWAPSGLSLAEVFSALVFVNAWLPNAITSVVDGGWSVAVEANFYVLLPFVLLVATTRNRALLITLIGGIAGLALSEAIIAQLRGMGSGMVMISFFKFWLPYQFLAFGLGILLFFRPDLPVLRRPLVFWPLMLAVVYIFFLRGKAFPLKLACLGVFALLLLENAGSLFVNRIVIFIGKISYSLYFLHFFVLRHLAEPIRATVSFLPGDSARFFGGFLVLVVITSAFATLTWVLIEKPFIRWGGEIANRWFGPRKPGKAEA